MWPNLVATFQSSSYLASQQRSTQLSVPFFLMLSPPCLLRYRSTLAHLLPHCLVLFQWLPFLLLHNLMLKCWGCLRPKLIFLLILHPPLKLPHPCPWFKLLNLCQQFSFCISIPDILLPELLTQIVNRNSSSSYRILRFSSVSWLNKWHHRSLKYSSQTLTVIPHTWTSTLSTSVSEITSSILPVVPASPPP